MAMGDYNPWKQGIRIRYIWPFSRGKGMKLLTKTHTNQRRLIEILRVVDESDKPVGARAISDCLCNRGYELGERAVRYNLKILDELGFTRKEGYSGRVLTTLGMRELDDALVNDRIGFVNTRIEEYMYKTSLDPVLRAGEVVVNASIIDKRDYEKVSRILSRVFDAGYTVSRKVRILDEGSELSSFEIPKGCLGIATVCSITIDGMLMKMGIPVNTSFAGIVEIQDRVSVEFTDLIAYSGSSLDPMKVFMARRMTRAYDAVDVGRGRVLANVREIPIAAEHQAVELLESANRALISGLIGISGPGEPLLGCPVGSGKIGLAFYAGINAAVAAEERGIEIKNLPISALMDYSIMDELPPG
jgi:repressor of nif and glnA expression